MYNPKISIITVVFNDKEGFDKTIKSIINLQYPEKEIIVIDGNSTDGTKEIILQNLGYLSKWVSEKDNGIYDAMNKGLEMATGEYVWFINAGDLVYDPDILEHLFKGNELLADVYYGETLIVSKEAEVLGLRKKQLPKQLSWHSFINGMTVCHQSVIIKREIAPKYDTSYKFSADYLWVLSCLKQAKTIVNTNRILSIFQEGGATTQNRNKSLKERYAIMKEHFGTRQTLLHHLKFVFEMIKPKYRKVDKKRLSLHANNPNR